MTIRRATEADLCRIAEIAVYNNRINYYPIFNDRDFSFVHYTVDTVREEFRPELGSFYVAEEDDGVVCGFMSVIGDRVYKLYVDSFFQGRGYGAALLEFATEKLGATHLYALEKNTRAIKFYKRFGFEPDGEKIYEEGTTEFLVHLVRRMNGNIK